MAARDDGAIGLTGEGPACRAPDGGSAITQAGLVGMDGNGVDFLRLAGNNAATECRLIGGLRRAVLRRRHRPGGRSARHLDRFFFARDQLFVLRVIGQPLGDQLARSLARARRHDFDLRGVGFDHRWRQVRSGGAEHRAITEGTGGADHRERKYGGDRHDADTPARRRSIVVDFIFLAGVRHLVLLIRTRSIASRRGWIIGRLVFGAIAIGVRGIRRVGVRLARDRRAIRLGFRRRRGGCRRRSVITAGAIIRRCRWRFGL